MLISPIWTPVDLAPPIILAKTTEALLDNGFAVVSPKSSGIAWDTNIGRCADIGSWEVHFSVLASLIPQLSDGAFRFCLLSELRRPYVCPGNDQCHYGWLLGTSRCQKYPRVRIQLGGLHDESHGLQLPDRLQISNSRGRLVRVVHWPGVWWPGCGRRARPIGASAHALPAWSYRPYRALQHQPDVLQ